MKLIVAALWGFLMGILTILMGPLSSASDNRIYEAFEWGLSWLVIPGLLIGTMAGSFTLSILINVALHASLCWLILRIFFRARSTAESERDEPAG